MIRAIIFDWGRTLFDSESGVLFPEAVETLRYLSEKYQLAIVSLATDGNLDERYELVREMGIEEHFASILFAQTDKDGLYALTLARLGLKAEEVAIVDDRVKRGITWGNRHGAITVWLRNGKFMYELPDDISGKPTHTINDLAEIRFIL